MKLYRLIFLILWILSLIAISFYGGTISYGFFFGLTLLPVCCLIYLGFVYHSFKLYQKVGNRNMVCGQPIPFLFVMQNESFFAFSGVSVKLFSSFSYVEELPDGREYELLPKDKHTFETRLVCKYRGEYEVGVKEITVTDFLRLFRIHYQVPETIRAIVLPKIVRVKELTAILDISTFLQKETLAAQTEPDVIVRDYVTGDSLKRIHWKATAREQKIKVRNLIGEEKQGITLFCDTNRCSSDMHCYLPIENKILETLLALSIFFAEKDISFNLYYGQSAPVYTQIRGLRDFEALYRRTADISFREEENTANRFLEAAMSGIFSESKVVFAILHTLDITILETIEQIIATGTVVVVYLITDQTDDKYKDQNSLRKRIIVISPDADLEGRL